LCLFLINPKAIGRCQPDLFEVKVSVYPRVKAGAGIHGRHAQQQSYSWQLLLAVVEPMLSIEAVDV